MTKEAEMALFDALVAGLPSDSYLHLYLGSFDVRAAVAWAMKSDFAEPDLHGLNMQLLQRQQEIRVAEEKRQNLLGEIANAQRRLQILGEIANDVEVAGERLAGQARALRQLQKTHTPTPFQPSASGRS